MKELKKEFIGIGEVRGFQFKQLQANGYAYVYEVYNPEANGTHYEVFERVENTIFDCISYPKSKSFGVWSWCIHDYQKAMLKYEEHTRMASWWKSQTKRFFLGKFFITESPAVWGCTGQREAIWGHSRTEALSDGQTGMDT